MITNHSAACTGSTDVHSPRAFRPLPPPAPSHDQLGQRPNSSFKPTVSEHGSRLHTRPESTHANRLWACLTSGERERLLPRSELVSLKPGMQLMHADQVCTHVFFPCSATVSLILTTLEGKSCQVGMVGNDGMVGVHGVIGGQRMPYEAVVRTAGTAQRISVGAMVSECGRGSEGQDLFLRYSHALMAQMAYAVVCCQHHSVEQRTCRLLLQAFDAVGDELHMTHELMAECVGVRRESITGVAHRLHQDGVISYSRGRILMSDRSALQSRSCECYRAVKQELESVFQHDALGASGQRRMGHHRSVGAHAAAN